MTLANSPDHGPMVLATDRNVGTSELRNFRTSELRNFGTSELRNFGTFELRNFGTSEVPKSRSGVRSRAILSERVENRDSQKPFTGENRAATCVVWFL